MPTSLVSHRRRAAAARRPVVRLQRIDFLGWNSASVCDMIQIASRSECVCGCVCEVTRSCWAASSDTRTTGQDQINHSRSQLQYHCSISPARPSRRTTCGPRRRCDPEAAQRFIEHLSPGVSEVPSLSLALYLQNSEPRVVPSSIVTLAHQNHARHHEKPRVVVVVCF